MDLMSAKDKARKLSQKKPGTKQYVLVDDEGECSVSGKSGKGAIHVYKNNSEIALEPEEAAVAPNASQKTRRSGVVVATANEDGTVTQFTVDSTTKKQLTMKQAAKKSAKTATKKTAKKVTKKTTAKKAAPKKAAKTAKAPKAPTEIKADSITAGVRQFVKEAIKKGVLIVKGKVYAVNVSESWAVRRTALEAGKDGIIMAIPSAKGFYLYPTKDHKELFGAIFKSNTFKNIGIYSQSVLPKSHGDYWTELK